MRPHQLAAAGLAVVAVVCSSQTGDGWPLYLRILAGAGAVVALVAALQVESDDLLGWVLAAGVAGSTLAVVAALSLLGVPGLDERPDGPVTLLLGSASLVVLGAGTGRAARSASKPHGAVARPRTVRDGRYARAGAPGPAARRG
jgi:hypothetical protein